MTPGTVMNRLYHVALSPFCRKVRLTLAEKKIEVELVEERYWEPSPDFLRRNPGGQGAGAEARRPADEREPGDLRIRRGYRAGRRP